MEYIAVFLCCLFGSISAYPSFADRFPNGHNVPNPCISPVTWNAVGHYHPTRHTMAKNPFGVDFKANNLTWTKELCRIDSDNDGHTNGEELGDPKCEWTVGATPSRRATGHPGICEPVDSHHCQFQNFDCSCLDKCPGLGHGTPNKAHHH